MHTQNNASADSAYINMNVLCVSIHCNVKCLHIPTYEYDLHSQVQFARKITLQLALSIPKSYSSLIGGDYVDVHTLCND